MAAFVKFWGTRGSIPTPASWTRVYGGNTPCVEVRFDDVLFICDAGSGIRELGKDLLTRQPPPKDVHLFITHTHWDHIQGFPFFIPAYDPSFKITVYGAQGFGKDLKSLFSGQLDVDYFPVQLENMRAKLNFVQLGPEPVELPGARVTWEFANHPG